MSRSANSISASTSRRRHEPTSRCRRRRSWRPITPTAGDASTRRGPGGLRSRPQPHAALPAGASRAAALRADAADAAHAADAVARVGAAVRPGRGPRSPPSRPRPRELWSDIADVDGRRAERRRSRRVARSEQAGDDAVWCGRMVPEKAPHLAIDAARLAGLPLRLAGPIVDAAYWEARGRAPARRRRALRGHLGPRAPSARLVRREPRRAHDAGVGGAVRSRGRRGDGERAPRSPRSRAAVCARSWPRRRRGSRDRGTSDPWPRRSVAPRGCRARTSARERCDAWASTPWGPATSACTAGSSRPVVTRRSSTHEDRLVRPSPRLRPPHAHVGGARAPRRCRGPQHPGGARGRLRLGPAAARRRRRAARPERRRIAALGAAPAPGPTGARGSRVRVDRTRTT